MSDYELRMIPAEDILPYRKLSSVMFRAKVWNDGEDEETVIRKHREEDAEAGEYFFRIGAYLDGTLYAAQEVLNYDIYFDGQPCRMSGIGGVISDFNSPKKGALKQIYARSFEIMLLLEQINALGTTVMVVTHEKSLVDRFTKRVVAINNGKVISDGMDGYYNYEEQ